MHGDDEGRVDRLDNLHHVDLTQSESTVYRGEQHVDLPEFRQVLGCQGVMQMAQMRDAEIAGREDEDQIATKLCAAIPGPDIRGHIADAYVTDLHVVVSRALAGIPAAQHQLDA